MSTRFIPDHKINGMRFGQLLVNALVYSGHLQPFLMPQDINSEGHDNRVMEYLVRDVDIFYMENDALEAVIKKYINENPTS